MFNFLPTSLYTFDMGRAYPPRECARMGGRWPEDAKAAIVAMVRS